MQRLFYTSCLTGKSVSGAAGFQVRAASRTLSDGEQASARTLGAYYLPKDLPADPPVESLPRRLALLDRPDGRRAACHSVYVGTDPSTGRSGNFFSDIVLGSAGELDPVKVLSSWRGAFWRTKDSEELKPELPDVEPRDLTPGTALTLTRLGDLAKQHKKLASFLLRALLVCDPKERVFVVAEPDAAAAALFVALHALPPTLRSEVTFSTYEGEHGSCQARVVATWFGGGAGRDLEDHCYNGRGAALNTLLPDRVSDLGPVPSFVPSAIAAIEAGKLSELTAFQNECEARKITSGAELTLFYRISRDKSPLTANEVGLDLAVQMARELLTTRPEMGRLVVDRAIDDPAFRRSPWPTYLKVIQALPDLQRELADHAWKTGLWEAKKDGGLDRCRAAWEEVYAKLTSPENIGKRLLKDVASPEKELPRPTRLFWLPQVLKAAGGFDKLPASADWCQASPDDLPEVLEAIEGNESARRKVTARTVRSTGAATPLPLVELVGESPGFAIAVVGEVATADPKKADELFKRVVARFPKIEWARELVVAVKVGDWPANRLDPCLVVALRGQTRFDLRKWLGEYAKRVQGELAGGDTPAVVAELILSSYAKEWSQEPSLAKYLDWVWNSEEVRKKLSREAQSRLVQQYAINAFCRDPHFDDTTLAPIKQALEGLGEQDDRSWWSRTLARNLPFGAHRFRAVAEVEAERVFEAVVNALLDLRKGRQPALESVLEWLSPALSSDGTWVELYRRLLARCAADGRFWSSTGVLSAFIAVCSAQFQHKTLSAYGQRKLFLDLGESIAKEYGPQLRANLQTPAGARLVKMLQGWSEMPEEGKKSWGDWWLGELRGSNSRRGVVPEWQEKMKEWLRDTLVLLGLAATLGILLLIVSSDARAIMWRLLPG